MKTVIHINTAITSRVQLTKEKKMCGSKKKKTIHSKMSLKCIYVVRLGLRLC